MPSQKGSLIKGNIASECYAIIAITGHSGAYAIGYGLAHVWKVC